LRLRRDRVRGTPVEVSQFGAVALYSAPNPNPNPLAVAELRSARRAAGAALSLKGEARFHPHILPNIAPETSPTVSSI
jgi:hypothetical protein